MSCRHNIFAESDVTLRALKVRFRLSLVRLVIQYASVIRSRSDVAALASARLNADFQSLRIQRVHRRNVVTMRAVLVLVNLVTECSC